MPVVNKRCFVHLGAPGGTPLYGLYGDVPLDRVWFSSSLPLCPEQGI